MLGNDMMSKADVVPAVEVMVRPALLKFPEGQMEHQGMKDNKIMTFFYVRR